MVRRVAFAVVGVVVSVLAACGGDGDTGLPNGNSGASTATGGAGADGAIADASADLSSEDGPSPNEAAPGVDVSSRATGDGGTGVDGTGVTAGGTTTEGGDESSVAVTYDAAGDRVSNDAAADASSEPPAECLDANQPCDDAGSSCCEAFVCRQGRCCMPNGVWSYCIANSDCCSNNCVLNQCTCVPLGYSCTGPGQCCSGFSCVNGTCICPPDIRGCP